MLGPHTHRDNPVSRIMCAERSVMKLWNDAQVKESFEKGKKVVTFFKSSTIGRSELAKVQEDLYGNKLGMLKQECKTRWSSTTISRWELTTGTLLDSVQLH